MACLETSITARFESLKVTFDEKSRRLWAAAEALSAGPNGVMEVNRATGISFNTIKRGIEELGDPEALKNSAGRTRNSGGGRKKTADTNPEIRSALEALVEPVPRGDPESPLRWTCKSLRTLAVELSAQGLKVSHRMVGELLREMGYSLQSNRKTSEGKQHPDRNEQFEFINLLAEDNLGRGNPVISVDAKTLNVAQQETVTTNTGPVAIPLAFKIREILAQKIPGQPWSWDQLRDSPFQVETGTIGTRYDTVAREMAVQAGKDNTVSQEQREWRVNLTSRYDFLEGMLKGFTVGGSLRYQSEISGGYPNILDAAGNVLPDIANPWLGPDEMDGDLFLRYNRKLTDKINWSVQLNARNLYRSHGAKDIPITFNPDGQVALARIPVEQQFFLTNTFSF